MRFKDEKGYWVEQPNNDFDWSIYDNGYTGGNSLKANRNIKAGQFTKVFCHEKYAKELYEKYISKQAVKDIAVDNAKDAIPGTIYNIVDVHRISPTEISVDTATGMTGVIDLNKERQFLETIGCPNIEQFTNSLTVSKFKKDLLDLGILAKVLKGDRISLWEGHLSKIKAEFMSQLEHPDEQTCAYNAVVKEINGGGYIVDIMGVKCFMPGSLAAAGIITDFTTLLGKTVPVMIANYVPKSGFIVSYKKYLNTILPGKIAEELYIGKDVYVKTTGVSKNGVFVQFKDKNGEWLFSGLIHRTVMSPDFEQRFDSKEFRVGDEFRAYVCNFVDSDKGVRVVLTDSLGMIPKDSSTDSQADSSTDE